MEARLGDPNERARSRQGRIHLGWLIAAVAALGLVVFWYLQPTGAVSDEVGSRGDEHRVVPGPEAAPRAPSDSLADTRRATAQAGTQGTPPTPPWQVVPVGDSVEVQSFDATVEDPGGWRTLLTSVDAAFATLAVGSFGIPARIEVRAHVRTFAGDTTEMVGAAHFEALPTDGRFEVLLVPSSIRSGVVVDESGTPLGEGAWVLALREPEPASAVHHPDPTGRRWQAVRTDASGEFRFRGLDPLADYRLHACGLGFASESPAIAPRGSYEPTVVSTLPLFGLCVRLDTSAGQGQWDAADVFGWDNSLMVSYLPRGSTPPLSSGNVAIRWSGLECGEAKSTDFARTMWRTASAMDAVPTVELTVRVPGFVRHMEQFELQRVYERLAETVVRLERSSDVLGEVTVLFRPPVYAAQLPHGHPLGTVDVLGAVEGKFSLQMTPSDLVGKHMVGVPMGATAVQFRTAGGVRYPEGPLGMPLESDGAEGRGAVIDLSGAAGLEFDLRHPDGSPFQGGLIVHLLQWTGPLVPPTAPGATTAPFIERPARAEVFGFANRPYLLPLLKDGRYGVSFSRGTALLSGEVQEVEAISGELRREKIQLRAPSGPR